MACESWHSLRSPRAREESTSQDKEERQGRRLLGVEVGKSSVQVHGLSPALTSAPGVCLNPGSVTIALRCSGLSERCAGSSHGFHACCFGDGKPPGSASVRNPGIPGL